MSDEPTTPDGEGSTTTTTTEVETEKSVPYERFDKVNKQAKEAKAQAAQLSKDMAELRAQMEERETAGLPELERERKRAEQLEKRAAEAEKRAEEAAATVLKGQRERWVTSAAAAQNFADPSDASAFLNLEDIEDEKDAERAVKRLAGQKKHLVKADEPNLPGRVLQNGQATVPAVKNGGIDPNAEAQMLADQLKTFLKGRRSTQL